MQNHKLYVIVLPDQHDFLPFILGSALMLKNFEKPCYRSKNLLPWRISLLLH